MGTSLSGLTPATTFDGLLKTSDNDAITSSLKTIGSGDGTDSCLQLSDSALQVNGDLNVGSVHQIKQNSNNLDIIGNSNSTYLKYITNNGNNSTNIFGVGNFFRYNVVIGEPVLPSTASEMLRVKGSGSTSATTSLLVQNSSGGNSLVVTDNGRVGVGGITSPSQPLHIDGNIRVGDANDIIYSNKFFGLSAGDLSISTSGNTLLSQTGNVGIGETTPSARLHVKGSGNDATTNSLLVENSDGTTMFRIKDSGYVDINPTNSSGGSLQVRGDGTDHLIFANANDNYVGIGGTQSSSSVRAYIKGKGATSATTSLLMQNSAGTDLFKVTDDGAIDFGVLGLEFSNDGSGGTMSIAGDRYIKLASALSTYSAFGGHIFKTFTGSAYSEVMRITGNTDQFVGIGETTPSAKLHVKVGTTQDSIAKFEDPRATTDYIEIKNDSILTDYTGLYWGTTAKIRSKQTGAMFLDCTSGILFADGNSARSKIDANGNMSIGSATIPASTRVTIQGQGATSATTALLVENSAGTDTLEVRDDGRVVTGKGATTNANGTFNVLHGVSNLTTRVFTVSRDSVLRGMDINSGGATKISDSSGDQSFSHTATAVLEVSSTNKGFLPPRMTGEQIDAIESPASGLIIYNTTTNKAQCYNGTDWNDMF